MGVFPLMWQLDTQLTLHGHPCDFNPELVYTTCPMSYIFWPPLVEQNKKDFGTDVQKDEHPTYLYGDKSYSVLLYPASHNTRPLPVQTFEASLNGPRFFLVGSWNDWNDWGSTTELKREDGRSTVYSATIRLSGGEDVEFQVECNSDHRQSMFPSPKGDRILGPSAEGHGKNWRLSVPLGAACAHIYWDPTGDRCISFTVSSSISGRAAGRAAVRAKSSAASDIVAVTY